MRVGLIGSGNMARALARGWGDPVLITDNGSGRAAALVAELGGKAIASNDELARQVDLVLLCHKPAQLDAVAREVAGHAPAVASVLGSTPISSLQAAYPDTPVFRLMPNTPVALRRGVVCYAPAPGVDPELEAQVIALFERVARVVPVEERLIDVATGIMGVGPAYLALVVEAQVDAAVKLGMPAARAAELATETMAGTAALIAARDHDTLAIRREVTSPGGSTARGLAALEEGGLRAAFQQALEAVVRGGDGR
jgi:pyrroline-5-carboxylate reductase